jgi:hypothetical protein
MILVISILSIILVALSSKGNQPVYTQVTALYDIKRAELRSGFKRPYELYLSFFDVLLGSNCQLIIFGEKELEEYVWKRRK